MAGPDAKWRVQPEHAAHDSASRTSSDRPELTAIAYYVQLPAQVLARGLASIQFSVRYPGSKDWCLWAWTDSVRNCTEGSAPTRHSEAPYVCNSLRNGHATA